MCLSRIRLRRSLEMKLTKEKVEMFKDDAENATYKHGYDMIIIDLCADWLEMHGEICPDCGSGEIHHRCAMCGLEWKP